MSPRHSCAASQILRGSSASGSPTYKNDRVDAPRNINGKRSRDDLGEDQDEVPRKVARLDSDDKLQEPQYPTQDSRQPSHDLQQILQESCQPPDPIADVSNQIQEQEFVDGPGHIIYVDERGKRCPAICFNELWLNTFTNFVINRGKVREGAEEIEKARLEVEQLESSVQSTAIEEAKRMIEDGVRLRKEAEAAVPTLVDARSRLEAILMKDKMSKLRLESSRGLALSIIETMLIDENLLTFPKPKPQEPPKAVENHSAKPAPVPERMAQDSETSGGSGNSWASSTRSPPLQVTTRERMTPRQLALRDLRLAAQDVDYYRRFFIQLQDANEYAAYMRTRGEQESDRPMSTTQTDFDLKILRNTQRVTRLVIEAEQAYDAAEQRALNLDLGYMLDDPEACHYGERFNDFRPPIPRTPHTAVSPVKDVRIEIWMDSVPNSATVDSRENQSVDVDDWDSKSLEVFESISQVDTDMYRKKIDQLREQPERIREGEAKRPSPGIARRNPRRRCRG
ncbi:hypothetical protein BDR22DRAFT_886466 [Usnea florida]